MTDFSLNGLMWDFRRAHGVLDAVRDPSNALDSTYEVSRVLRDVQRLSDTYGPTVVETVATSGPGGETAGAGWRDPDAASPTGGSDWVDPDTLPRVGPPPSSMEPRPWIDPDKGAVSSSSPPWEAPRTHATGASPAGAGSEPAPAADAVAMTPVPPVPPMEVPPAPDAAVAAEPASAIDTAMAAIADIVPPSSELGAAAAAGGFALWGLASSVAGHVWSRAEGANRMRAEVAAHSPWVLPTRDFQKSAKLLFRLERAPGPDGRETVRLVDKTSGAVAFEATSDVRLSARHALALFHAEVVETARRRGAEIPGEVDTGLRTEVGRVRREMVRVHGITDPSSIDARLVGDWFEALGEGGGPRLSGVREALAVLTAGPSGLLANRHGRNGVRLKIARAAPWVLPPRDFQRVASKMFRLERMTASDGRQRLLLLERKSGRPVMDMVSDSRTPARAALALMHRTLVENAARRGQTIPERTLAAVAEEAQRHGLVAMDVTPASTAVTVLDVRRPADAATAERAHRAASAAAAAAPAFSLGSRGGKEHEEPPERATEAESERERQIGRTAAVVGAGAAAAATIAAASQGFPLMKAGLPDSLDVSTARERPDSTTVYQALPAIDRAAHFGLRAMFGNGPGTETVAAQGRQELRDALARDQAGERASASPVLEIYLAAARAPVETRAVMISDGIGDSLRREERDPAREDWRMLERERRPLAAARRVIDYLAARMPLDLSPAAAKLKLGHGEAGDIWRTDIGAAALGLAVDREIGSSSWVPTALFDGTAADGIPGGAEAYPLRLGVVTEDATLRPLDAWPLAGDLAAEEGAGRLAARQRDVMGAGAYAVLEDRLLTAPAGTGRALVVAPAVAGMFREASNGAAERFSAGLVDDMTLDPGRPRTAARRRAAPLAAEFDVRAEGPIAERIRSQPLQEADLIGGSDRVRRLALETAASGRFPWRRAPDSISSDADAMASLGRIYGRAEPLERVYPRMLAEALAAGETLPPSLRRLAAGIDHGSRDRVAAAPAQERFRARGPDLGREAAGVSALRAQPVSGPAASRPSPEKPRPTRIRRRGAEM